MREPFINAAAIRAATFVRHVEVHETIGSTNDRAIELAQQLDANELPALVVTREQTAGRGQRGNRWWSADGALTFSLLIDPAHWNIAQRNWPMVSLAVAEAICGALRLELPNALINVKPPNDVLVDGRKVCGILIESPGGVAPAKDRLIIGVGVNVNNSWRLAPADVGQVGTALCDVSGRLHEQQPVLVNILQRIAEQLAALGARLTEVK